MSDHLDRGPGLPMFDNMSSAFEPDQFFPDTTEVVAPEAPEPTLYSPPSYFPDPSVATEPATQAPVFTPPPFAPPAPPAAAEVVPVSAAAVADIVGFDPEQFAPSAPAFVAPAPPVAPTTPGVYVAPEVQRPVMQVPLASPLATVAEEPTGNRGIVRASGVHLASGRPAIERLLTGLVLNNGSDLHMAPGQPPRYRVAGAVLAVPGEPDLSGEEIEALLKEAINPRAMSEFDANGDLDTRYDMSEEMGSAITSRFRLNVYREMGKTGCVFRVIPTNIVTLDELGIPSQVKDLAALPRGLVLFCGPTGSGKSTSMAGLVDLINETRDDRIITLEDPIEFVHTSKRSLISHREVGEDTPSFAEGLRRVRRQNPNVILIGEMRDYETIGAAIEAANTGHLVIGTLHTNSAPETVSTIINFFPDERQQQVKTMLASCLKAVVCQVLVPSPTSARGRVVATEIMMVTAAISNNIRESDIPAIANALTDRNSGSISLDAHLAQLFQEGKITKVEAEKKASSPAALRRQLGESR